jgi:hypothetical protein
MGFLGHDDVTLELVGRAGGREEVDEKRQERGWGESSRMGVAAYRGASAWGGEQVGWHGRSFGGGGAGRDWS